MKQLVKESLFENFEPGKKDSRSFGEAEALRLIHTYLPYLKDVEYMDYGDRDSDNVEYGDDDTFDKWDHIMITTGIEAIDEIGCTILLGKNGNEIGIKFYCDTVAFTTTDEDDEYINWVEPMPIESFTKKDYNVILRKIRKSFE